MYSTYRLHTTELNEQFLESLKNLFGDQEIEIAVWDIEKSEDRALTRAMTRASEAAFARVWDNEEDAIYDQL